MHVLWHWYSHLVSDDQQLEDKKTTNPSSLCLTIGSPGKRQKRSGFIPVFYPQPLNTCAETPATITSEVFLTYSKDPVLSVKEKCNVENLTITLCCDFGRKATQETSLQQTGSSVIENKVQIFKSCYFILFLFFSVFTTIFAGQESRNCTRLRIHSWNWFL